LQYGRTNIPAGRSGSYAEWDENGLRKQLLPMCFTTPVIGLTVYIDTATANNYYKPISKIDLNGFSSNVKEIIEKFKLKVTVTWHQKMCLDVLEKFTSRMSI
jgi:type I restriction enzyme M protein